MIAVVMAAALIAGACSELPNPPGLPTTTPPEITATVRGRVQGVGFRVATRRVAQGLGVSGWVRNLPDGSVAVFAQGDPESIDDLLAFLAVGPPAAHVTGVEIAEATPARHLLGFDVTR